MRKKSAEQTLQSALRQGEQVLWSGKSAAFPLLAGDSKLQIIGRWVGAIAGAAAILALYVGNAGGRSMGAILGVLAVAAVIMVSPFVEQRSVLRQFYCITNQRVILISGDQTTYYMALDKIDEVRTVTGKTEYGTLAVGSIVFEDITNQRVILISGDQTTYYMALDKIDEVRTVTGKTEYGTLAVGSIVFEDIKHQLRWRGCHPKMDAQSGRTSGEAQGLVLFNLRDCRAAEVLLRHEETFVEGPAVYEPVSA